MSSSLKTRIITAAVALPIIICSIVFLPYLDHLAFAIIIIAVNAIGTWELHNNILKKKIDVPFVATENIDYYKNYVNEKETSKSINLNDMNAWQLASNPESAAVTVTQRAYVKDYPVKADIGTFTLIKANFLSYLGIIVLVVVAIVLILLIIRAINLRKRRRRRRNIF